MVHLWSMYGPSMVHVWSMYGPVPPKGGDTRVEEKSIFLKNLSGSVRNAKNPAKSAGIGRKYSGIAKNLSGDSIVRKDPSEEDSFVGFASWTHLGFWTS